MEFKIWLETSDYRCEICNSIPDLLTKLIKNICQIVKIPIPKEFLKNIYKINWSFWHFTKHKGWNVERTHRDVEHLQSNYNVNSLSDAHYELQSIQYALNVLNIEKENSPYMKEYYSLWNEYKIFYKYFIKQ